MIIAIAIAVSIAETIAVWILLGLLDNVSQLARVCLCLVVLLTGGFGI